VKKEKRKKKNVKEKQKNGWGEKPKRKKGNFRQRC
jgi:hypothetical protein